MTLSGSFPQYIIFNHVVFLPTQVVADSRTTPWRFTQGVNVSTGQGIALGAAAAAKRTAIIQQKFRHYLDSRDLKASRRRFWGG
jgi:hypothetical protein